MWLCCICRRAVLSMCAAAMLPAKAAPVPGSPCPLAAGQDLKQLDMLEGQLTWLVHIIGAVVRGRMNTTGGAGGGQEG